MKLQWTTWDMVPRHNACSSMLRRHPYVLLAALTFMLSVTFYSYQYEPFKPEILPPVPTFSSGPFEGAWNTTRDARNLLMSDAQCSSAFPNLFKEIDRAVEFRKIAPITVKELESIVPVRGYNRAMIYDNQLYMLGVDRNVNLRDQATLHALHRAIVTSPEPLPNIEFVLNVDDIATTESASPATWAFSRQAANESLWLMPDFGYWSWPEPKIGSYGKVQMKAMDMDSKVSWNKKIPRLAWRGATLDLEVREQLLNASIGKPWADVKILDWVAEAKGEKHDIISMDEHCRYKFVAHTEGISYSARLQNLQNCKSVVVAHKLKWIQHHHHLMISEGPEQNFVEVAADFTGLDEAMVDLVVNDEKALRIAENSVRTFRDWYLTPAAETCYWRKLIRGWASVSFEPEFYTGSGKNMKWRGLPVESFFLEREMDWDYH